MTKEQEPEQARPAAETDIEEEQKPAETAAAGPEAGSEAPAKEDLELLLEDARAKADDHWGKLVRAKAELENLRKRQERELANAHKFALERFVAELLPVRDSLELGLSAAQDDNADVAKLREGTELTLNLFTAALEKFNVAVVDPQGQPFDPELHQAISTQPRDDVEPNTVINVVQKGYTLNGRLVRPAMVVVSQAPEGNIDEQA
ncbi:MAG TPA: nucleotide exchange factor GrpE [Sedimenticola sp.]|nr:nucleotide exchange factor GrpE [Sedimenticola sp.]